MDAAARLAKLHPKIRKRLSENPKYVSARRKEFDIRAKDSKWYIHQFHGGMMPKSLRGLFTSFSAAEAALIAYLRRTDKFGLAIYPGSK